MWVIKLDYPYSKILLGGHQINEIHKQDSSPQTKVALKTWSNKETSKNLIKNEYRASLQYLQELHLILQIILKMLVNML